MAIAFDAAYGLQSNTGTVHTYSHTCTGSNLVLLVCTMISSSYSVSSVTYAGQSLTNINESTGGSAGQKVGMWYLIAPSTGANDVVVTISTSSFCYPSSASYTGVAQSSPIDVNTTGADVSSRSLTTTVDNCWTVLGARDGGDGVTTASTGSTSRFSTDTQMYDSAAVISPAGLYTMNLSGAGVNTTMTMVAIKPSVDATRRLLLLGCGT